MRRCTFTGNRNAVDDSSRDNVYESSIFWKNDAPGGWPPGDRYEMDIRNARGVTGCVIGGGTIADLQGRIDAEANRIDGPAPDFDAEYRPRAEGFEEIGYRPPAD